MLVSGALNDLLVSRIKVKVKLLKSLKSFDKTKRKKNNWYFYYYYYKF